MYKTPPKSSTQTTPSRSESDITKLCADEALLSTKTQENITQRAKRRRQSPNKSDTESFADEFTIFKNEITSIMKNMINDLMLSQNSRMDKIENHILEIKSQYKQIEEKIGEIDKSMTNVSDQLTSLESKITGLETDRVAMDKKITFLEEKLDHFERSSIKTCVEIRNVPKVPNENKNSLYNKIKTLSKTLEIELQSSDIRDISRLPSKKDSKTSNVTVEFSNTLLRHNFLDSAKLFNKNNVNGKLNSTHLGFDSLTNCPIYIAEQLTTYAKKLFFNTRSFAKTNQYTYCWVSNGRIMLRKSTDSPHIIVKNEQQLNDLCLANKA